MSARKHFRLDGQHIVSERGVRLSMAAAATLAESYDALFRAGIPANPWPPFLDQARTHQQRAELQAAIAEASTQGQKQ